MTADQSAAAPPDDGLPDCEGWVCQSCGADNFIPAGFARIPTPPTATDERGQR